MIQVYISARYEDRQKARELRALLECYRGVTVKASWLEGDETPMGALTPETSLQCALSDIEEIREADVFVRLNPVGGDRAGTGGRHVEFGLAIGFGIPVVVVGELLSVFDYLNVVRQVGPDESVAKVVREVAVTA